MICAYCKKDKAATKEHIIPKSLIDLFPECDYVYDKKKDGTKVYKSESIIKDVCAECNNGELSKLDTYGSQVISKYFLNDYKKDDTQIIEYDYNLFSRWLLKIIYNTHRSLKNEVTIDTSWFEENIDYILGIDKESKYNISIFSGIFVNTSPMPLFWSGNIQLDIVKDPQILLDGLLVPKDSIDRSIGINEQANDVSFENLYLKYLLKCLWHNRNTQYSCLKVHN